MAAAREAAAKGVPALALSLDHYSRDADYGAAVEAATLLVRVLSNRPDLLARLSGVVLNVNVPGQKSVEELRGFALTRQSYEATHPAFLEVDVVGDEMRRRWVNAFGGTRADRAAGGDAFALAAGFVAITIVTLLSHIDPDPILNSGSDLIQQAAPVPGGLSDAAAVAVLEAAAAAVAAAPGARFADLCRFTAPAE